MFWFYYLQVCVYVCVMICNTLKSTYFCLLYPYRIKIYKGKHSGITEWELC